MVERVSEHALVLGSCLHGGRGPRCFTFGQCKRVPRGLFRSQACSLRAFYICKQYGRPGATSRASREGKRLGLPDRPSRTQRPFPVWAFLATWSAGPSHAATCGNNRR